MKLSEKQLTDVVGEIYPHLKNHVRAHGTIGPDDMRAIIREHATSHKPQSDRSIDLMMEHFCANN